MFCIAAFIVLLIMSAVSARYRRYLGKAWGCTFRRITLRPCDTSFKNEAKSKLLARVAAYRPGWVKTADVLLEIGALLIVITTVWSLFVVAKGGLNLFVYDTCYPSDASSCSLGSEACSIGTAKIGFFESVQQFKVHEWAANEVGEVGQAIADIPARLQDWEAENYLPANPTYMQVYDENKPTAVEVIDPGCVYCQNLYRNILASDFEDEYNVTYIAYPIADDNGYKFPHSLLMVQYLEALRLYPQDGAEVPADWQLLDKIFTGTNEQGSVYQSVINTVLSQEQVQDLLEEWLVEFGYSSKEIETIKSTAESSEVSEILEANTQLVEDEIKTVKIPTIIFDGKRHHGALSVEDLSR